MDNTTASDSPGGMHKRPLTLAETEQRQTAAISSGLYVRAEPGRRQRNYRAGRLLTRLLAAFADRGLPLTALQIPLGRAWCECEILASDAYAALQADRGGQKGMAGYLSVRRIQLSYAVALGMSPATQSGLARDLAALAKEVEGARAEQYFERYRISTPND